MKSKGCTAIITGKPSSVPRAAAEASTRPVLARASLNSVGVAFLVAETQRIGRHLPAEQFVVKEPASKYSRKTLRRTDAHVMAALRTDILSRDQVAMENHLAAGRSISSTDCPASRCRARAAHQTS